MIWVGHATRTMPALLGDVIIDISNDTPSLSPLHQNFLATGLTELYRINLDNNVVPTFIQPSSCKLSYIYIILIMTRTHGKLNELPV